MNFGISTDKPVAADYDGDGRADQAIYRGNGEWHLNQSSLGYAVVNFGLATDKLVPADYDGDGKADQAVYRDGTWYVLQSSNGFTAFPFGLATDIPAPADYDGDGRTDAAVFATEFGICGKAQAEFRFNNSVCQTTSLFRRLICRKYFDWSASVSLAMSV